MIRSINYLNQQNIIHNDIKLENFMLELPGPAFEDDLEAVFEVSES